MQALLGNRVLVLCAMAVLTFALTQGLKWVCVKPWTNKIENERARKAINTIIFFFPYAIALGLEFVYATFVLKGEPNALVGLIVGGGSHSVYGFFEMIYGVITGKIKVKKVAQTAEEKAVEDFVFDISKDGKIDGNDHPALKAFLDKVK
jgi:cytochrome bd-type quinol oxidase subunit 2